MMIPRKDLGQINPGKLKKVHFVGLLSPFSSYSAKSLLNMAEWVIVLASAGDLHNIVDEIRK